MNKQPGMMTLIGVAITAAYVYSSSVVFGVQGNVFFWELATLIDIMLFGQWIERPSKSVGSLGKIMKNGLLQMISSQYCTPIFCEF